MTGATGGRAAQTPTRPPLITCRPAASHADLAEHHAIRHAVFVVEQQVFEESDRDGYDDTPGVVHLLGRYDGAPAGAVRLFPLHPDLGIWQGDRLGVLAQYRVHGVGGPLVRCAVATAASRGGSRMVAHIQQPNVDFFTRLGWQTDGPTENYAGLAHQPMRIELPAADTAAAIARELFG